MKAKDEIIFYLQNIHALQDLKRCSCGGIAIFKREKWGGRIRGLYGVKVFCTDCGRHTPLAMTYGAARAEWERMAEGGKQ